jgi:hypothetical protein
MAIQLSDRDTLIFKFIDEHHVLLEKHIAWFISCDDKPVLIRDRLRKLFYLDYLLCERHGGKLPWWTTPTKPLVYMLSPMSRQLLKAGDSEFDLSNCDTQRHLLEVANLRMLFLVDQKEGLISEVDWTTIKRTITSEQSLDAYITFKRNGALHKIGLINHPTSAEKVVNDCHSALSEGRVDSFWVISRDEVNQAALQKALANTSIASKLAFATHQDIYKSGVVKAKWQSTNGQFASVIAESVTEPIPWSQGVITAPAV